VVRDFSSANESIVCNLSACLCSLAQGHTVSEEAKDFFFGAKARGFFFGAGARDFACDSAVKVNVA
jgi:hypothetical protein